MDRQTPSGKTIWDVIYSLGSEAFPVHRKYYQEPRGSGNPLNGQVSIPPSQSTVELVKKAFPDPTSLCALDFELNYAIRRLADMALYAYEGDIADRINDPDHPVLENTLGGLYGLDREFGGRQFYEYCQDALNEALYLSDHRDEIRNGNYNMEKWTSLLKFAEIQTATQFIIEQSDSDWKTKAEAFLRASAMRDYSPADDETIIYLCSQGEVDPELEKEAQYRWERYRKEWGGLFFTEDNPFDGDRVINRMRFMHWDKLSALRPFEPKLSEGDLRSTYGYRLESQHLLSPEFLADFVRVFSLFRTDLNVDPIRGKLAHLIRKFLGYWSASRDFEYNYTYADFYRLSHLLASFVLNRFQHDVTGDDKSRPLLSGCRQSFGPPSEWSTGAYRDDIPMVTLVALEVHASYYSRAQGMVEFLRKAKEWFLAQQTAYGYWYDGVNHPEYTTVLVLDALNLIDGARGLTFPLQCKVDLPSDIIHIDMLPKLIVNCMSRSLLLGNEEIRFRFRKADNKMWDFLMALLEFKKMKMPLSRLFNGHDWKNQYDNLSRKIGGSDMMNHFIITDGDQYFLTDNVIPNNHSTIRAAVSSDRIDKLDPTKIRQRF